MWRNSALRAEIIPGVDGRVGIALLIFLVHISTWTFCIFAGTCAFFWFLDRRGYTLNTAWLRFRRIMIGDVRTKWTAQEFNRRLLPGDPPMV